MNLNKLKRIAPGLAIPAALILGWAVESKADSGSFAGFIWQKSGSTQGFVTTLNCSTGVTCSSAGGVLTATASGSAGVSSLTGDGALITNSASTGAVTLTLGTAIANALWGNNTGSTTTPAYHTLTSYLDNALSSTQGATAYRGSATWNALAPGTNGQCLLSGGAAANPSWGSCGSSSSGSGWSGWSGLPLTFATNATQYAAPVGGALTSATESVVQLKASATATVSGLQVTISAPLGVAATLAVTLRDGGVSQSLTCTTASGGTTCADTTHTVSVTQGDLLSFQLVSSGTVTAGLPQIEIMYAVVGPGGGGGGGASITRGVFASAPSCTSAVGLYFFTDIPGYEQCNATTYQPFMYENIPSTLPGSVSFSWRNQGGASVTANGVINLTVPTNGSNSVRGREVAVPSIPFHWYACMDTALSWDEFNAAGIYESDGTKLLTLELQGGLKGDGSNATNSTSWAVSEWNSATSFNSNIGSNFASSGTHRFCLQWFDDGTNNNWYYSTDGMVSWNLVATAGDTAWLAPTVIGWFGNINKSVGGISQSANITLFHWNP